MAWLQSVGGGGGAAATTIPGVAGLQVALDSKVALPVVTPISAAAYLATDVDLAIEVNSTFQAVTITLPGACTLGRRYSVLWISGAFPVTIVSSAPGTRLIVQEDGSLAASVTMSVVGEALTYYAGSARFQRI